MTAARVIPPAFGALVLLAALGVIELLLRAGMLNRYVLPLPSDIAASFPRVIAEEGLLSSFLQTALEGAAAAALISLVGVSIGWLLYRHATWRLATQGGIAAFAAAPLVLAYPLFLVIFGRSQLTLVMMGFFSGVAPVILKTVEGLTATRRVLISVGRLLALTPAQQFRLILFPAALPTIFVGLRLGLIFALINIVGLEFLINLGGLGELINVLAERYDLPGTYATIVFVVLISVLFFILIERIERWLRPAS